MITFEMIYNALRRKYPKKNSKEVFRIASNIWNKDYAENSSMINCNYNEFKRKYLLKKVFKKRKINKSNDAIFSESRGRYIFGTFKCYRCGKTFHNGYCYKSYYNICMECRRVIMGKSGSSAWCIYTPM